MLEGIVTGISRARSGAQIFVIVYDETVDATLRSRKLENVYIQRIGRVQDLFDKIVVAQRVRSAVRRFRCDVLLTLNFFVPRVLVPQIVYHVDLERFEHHSIVPPILFNITEKIRDRRAKLALINAAANVFESRFLRQAAVTYHNKIVVCNPSVIYIGIDENSIVEAGVVNDQLDDGLIVSVTNPLEYKNNGALVPVLAELQKREPNVNWRVRIFGGEGESVWGELIALAVRAGVRDRFEFMGYQNRAVLNASLDSAICEFNTSKLESFCMVALEAMARGCPVVVSSEAAMPESVGSAGFVIDPDDFKAVADKIVHLRNAPDVRMEIKRKSVVWARRLTWSQSGEAFVSLCDQTRASKKSVYRN